MKRNFTLGLILSALLILVVQPLSADPITTVYMYDSIATNWSSTGVSGTYRDMAMDNWKFTRQAGWSGDNYYKVHNQASNSDGNFNEPSGSKVWSGALTPNSSSAATIYAYGDGNGGANKYAVSSGKYYTFVFKDVSTSSDSNGFVFETDSAPVTIPSVSQAPGLSATCIFNENVTVTVTLSGAKSSQEKVYLRYTTNDWASTAAVEISSFDSNFKGVATIPAQSAGTTVRYYVLTTATTVSNNDPNADLKTINFNNNNASNYSYTVADSGSLKYTTGDGNWSDTSKWNGSSLPGTTADVIVRHSLTLNQAATIKTMKICPGATFNGGSAQTLTLKGSDSASPTLTNAGTFTAGTGTIHFEGQTNQTVKNNGKVWGPNATTFNNVTISYNGNGTGGNDTFGVDFYDQSTSQRATINGILTINTRGFVAHAEIGSTGTGCSNRDCGTPNYGASSTLKYNDLEYPEGEPGSCPGTNAEVPFQVFGEWLDQTAQPGAPTNVTINADSWVSLNCNKGNNYRVNGNFTIDAGVDGTTYILPGFEQNGFNLGDLSTSTLTLAAGKDVINNGALKQSGTPGSGTTSFVNIKDTTGATLYYGIDITNGSGLGATTVKVNGNFGSSAGYCPNWGSGSGVPTVKRCYYMDPTNAGSSQVTFYYEYDELNSLDPAQLYVWKDNGDGTWTQITPASRSACTSGIACSVTVSSLSLAAGANRYVLSPAGPTAVTLTGLVATAQGDAIEVTWDTTSEVDNLGFNLYRDTSEAGPGVKLNAGLIPAQGAGSPLGHHYSYLDAADLVPGVTYTYWLEDVSTTGVATRHAPVSVTFGGEPNAVGLAAFGYHNESARLIEWAAQGALAALGAVAAGAAARRRRARTS